MRPVVFLREARQEARGGDAAARAPADVREVGEVARQAFLVVVPQRQLPGAVLRVVARAEQRARQRVAVAEEARGDMAERDHHAPVSVAMSTTASGSKRSA